MIDAAVQEDWFAVVENALHIIGGVGLAAFTIIAIFSGPAAPIPALIGVAIAAICHVIISILQFFKPKGESIISQVRKVIVEELKRYEYNEVTKRKVQGWCQVEASIIQELNFHHQNLVETGTCSYKGFDPQRLDNERELMGEIVFLAQEQFAELVEEKKESKGNAEKCLDCIGGYASIAKYYIMILSLQTLLCCQTIMKSVNPSKCPFSEDIKFLDFKIKAAESDAKNFSIFYQTRGC